MRIFGSLIALAIVSPPATAQETDPRWETLKRANEADHRDCPKTLQLIKPLLKPGAMDGLPDEYAPGPYHIAAMCYARIGNLAEARRMALAGTALPGALDEFWHFRLGYDLYAGDHVAAVATMTAMTQGRGRALNTMQIRYIYELHQALRQAKADALLLQFLKIVTDDAYDPEQPGASKDGFRKTLAEKRVAMGDNQGAAALVAGIETTSILVELSFDPRFRSLIPADFDPRAAAERELSRARTAMQRYPDALAPLNEAAGSLRLLGRPKEALDILESARAGGKKPTDRADAADQMSWWWNALASTHEMMGNIDAVVAAFGQGVALKENGAGNISQMINLAHAQNRFGRYADALRTLPATDIGLPLSPYGAIAMRSARGCANAGLGNAKAAALDLAYIRAHVRDNWKALPSLLLCTGDMDGAAAVMIANLEGDEYRARSLLWLSDYDPPLPGEPQSVTEKRLGELKQRADIKAAIAKAGGIRRIRLQAGEW